MKTKAVIFGGGDLPKTIDLHKLCHNRTIIAADGGYNKLAKINLKAHYLLGDFDSINIDPTGLKDVKIIKLKEEDNYNYTDMDLAVRTTIDLGFKDVYLIGAIGGRADHSFINIIILKHFLDHGGRGVILDDLNRITVSVGELTIQKLDYKYLSVIPIYDKTIIDLEGFKYPLKNHQLEIGNSLSISNEIIENKGLIRSNKEIIVVQARDSYRKNIY